MKKLFLIGAILALFITSCGKDDAIDDPKIPITGVELPTSDSDNPTIAGSPVTIKGKGFTEASEIWLRVATRSTSDVKATITAVTQTEITFTAPDVEGSQSIVLKQDSKEQILGEIFFAKEELPVTKEEVFAFVYDDNVFLNKYDSKTGEFIKQDGNYNNFITYRPYSRVRTLNNTLYYIGYQETATEFETSLVKYDLKTNQVDVIKKGENGDREIIDIVLIDTKLHAVILDETNGIEVVEISDSGTETLIKRFGHVEIDDELHYDDFFYDKPTNTIYGAGEFAISGGGIVFSLSLETGKIKFSTTIKNIISISDKFLTSETNESTEAETYFEVNPATLEKGKNIGEGINFVEETYSLYSKSSNMVFMGVYNSSNFNIDCYTYDISTQILKKLGNMTGDNRFEFFIMQATE